MVNEGRFFLSHRLELALEALRRGDDVLVVCGRNTGEERFREHGIPFMTFHLTRSGANPISEVRSLTALRRIYRGTRPDLVHHVTIKPVLYGTAVARWCGVGAVVNAVPGLGFLFTGEGLWPFLRTRLVLLLYRLAMSHPNMAVIFQNGDDRRVFLEHGLVSRVEAKLIQGSGVDLERFSYKPPAEGDVTFLLVARMLRDKGVMEFVDAARALKRQRPGWRFQLAGDVDPGNPTSLRVEEIRSWERSGTVEWLGRRDDVAELMAHSSVVVLPSYREGMPKVLLEAAAVGRPMIASDIAGCRQIVRPGETGLLVQARSSKPLTEAMLTLGDDPALRQQMGIAARELAEKSFSVRKVVSETFSIYADLLS